MSSKLSSPTTSSGKLPRPPCWGEIPRPEVFHVVWDLRHQRHLGLRLTSDLLNQKLWGWGGGGGGGKAQQSGF